MHYLKSLAINFLVIFFADYVLPGIEVVSQTKLPHIGGDLIFAFVLGLLNSLIYPALRVTNQGASALKIALAALILNFTAYAVIKLLPIGIHITSVEGYILVAVAATLGGFLTNFFEMKRHQVHKPDLPSL